MADGTRDVAERESDDRFVDSELADEAADQLDEEEQDIEERASSLLRDKRRIFSLLAAVFLLIVAIYVVLPKIFDAGDALDKLDEATWYWIVVAAAFNGLSFLSYMALFRGVLGGRDNEDAVRKRLNLKASYQITMAGFVATVLFSAAGAGGVALTYWALRKAGMERRRAACRMVAFTVLLYSMYAYALIIFGVLLRTGVLPGDHPAGGTIVPAAFAVVLLVFTGLLALVPQDAERRIRNLGKFPRLTNLAATLARVPATLASGVRTAIAYLRHPKRQAVALLGAIGWWAGNIGVLWGCFMAFGVHPSFGVLVQGYFVGMIANLAPSPAGGVGTVDAGMIASFALFGFDLNQTLAPILLFRFVGFWLPIPVGVAAYLGLRKTVHQWENETPAATIKSEVTAEAR
jgi:putative heme transporter